MICLRNVSKTVASGAEQLTILDAVDLDVPRGQFVAVTGPSGSGKSTLLWLVAGTIGSAASVAVTWAMSTYGAARIPWHPQPVINVVGLVATVVLVTVVGVAASWSVITRKPLGILRSE